MYQTSSCASIWGVSWFGGGAARSTRSIVSLGDRVRVLAENMAAVPSWSMSTQVAAVLRVGERSEVAGGGCGGGRRRVSCV